MVQEHMCRAVTPDTEAKKAEGTATTTHHGDSPAALMPYVSGCSSKWSSSHLSCRPNAEHDRQQNHYSLSV